MRQRIGQNVEKMEMKSHMHYSEALGVLVPQFTVLNLVVSSKVHWENGQFMAIGKKSLLHYLKSNLPILFLGSYCIPHKLYV